MPADICHKPRHCPFSSQPLVQTNNTHDLQSAINQHMEARQIRIRKKYGRSKFQVNRVAFTEAQVLGIVHSDALNVTSDVFTSAHMVMPLSGGVIQNGSKGKFDVRCGEGVIISPGQQLDMQWLPETVAMTMRVPETTLQRYLTDYFNAPLYKNIVFDGKFNWADTETIVLREMLSAICKELQNPNSLFSRGITSSAIEEQLILTFIDSLPSNYSEAVKVGHENHKPKHVKRAMEYVIANSINEICVIDLVKVSGVSLRTLQNGFKDYCGISPMAWVRNHKLYCVRDALLDPAYDDVSIGDLAARWGFYHTSNFARNYLALFGEHASYTRRKRLH